jgi:aminoglycoside phosphotransferase (APT) family kinase protein
VSVPFPTPMFFGSPTSYYPYNFLGYDYWHDFDIDGINAINGKDSVSILATFLSQLHSVPIEEVKNIVGYDDLDRLNIKKRRETLVQNTDMLKKTSLYDTSKLESYISNLTDIRLDDEKTLVHGDMHIKNLLYNSNGVVSSVIDFGDMHIGHRAIDISIIYSIIPTSLRKRFFEKYGEVSQEALEFARFKAIFSNTFLFLNAYNLGNTILVKKIITSLDNALS